MSRLEKSDEAAWRAAGWRALFRPKERVGWVFNDRNQFRQRIDFPQPVWAGDAGLRRPGSAIEGWLGRSRFLSWLAPVYAALADFMWPLVVNHGFGGPQPLGLKATWGLTEQQSWVEAEAQRRMRRALPIAGAVFTVFFLWWVTLPLRGAPLGSPLWGIGSAVVYGAAAAGVWIAAMVPLSRAASRYWERSYQVYRTTQLEPWKAARERALDEEEQRLSGISDWKSVSVPSGTQRLDVVGGSLHSQEALLTVLGASILGEGRPLTVLDLTGDIVVAELVCGAQSSGYTVGFALLPIPSELARINLLTGLSAARVANLFVEARHGGPGEAADRALRAVDERILTEVCAILEPGGLSMGRIADALGVLMRDPSADSVLTDTERAQLAQETFSDDYREQTLPNMRDLEAMAHPLSAMGTGQVTRLDEQLRVLSMSSEWSSAKDDFLCDLLIGWVARQVVDNPASVPTLIVAGAERLAKRHSERLSDLCERRRVRLVMMFKELDEETDAVLGEGPVAFMRLSTHEQAARAAQFIGSQESFKLSHLSKSIGGDQTHSVAHSNSTTLGEGGSHTTGTSSQGRANGWNTSDTTSWNRSRTWGETVTEAEGRNWSHTRGLERVYEHRVRPEEFRQLPDYGLVLVQQTGDGQPVQVTGIDINPEIAVLDAYPAAAIAGAGSPIDILATSRRQLEIG